MLIRVFDKIAGIPEGTVKDVPRGVASAMVSKGYAELVEKEEKPVPAKKVSKPKTKKK